jgi:hypothetical protein
VVVTSLAACLASAPASAQALRAGKSELSASPVFTLGKNYGFPVGASAKTDSGFGLGIQWHYNFDGYWSAGLDAEIGGADYTGTAAPSAPSATPAFSFDARTRTTTLRLAFDYNFSPAQLTPFVTGGFGLAFVDAVFPPRAVRHRLDQLRQQRGQAHVSAIPHRFRGQVLRPGRGTAIATMM